MKESNPVIEIRGLTRRYGKVEAVNGLNLTVRAGCCYGFFGRNGAGKTTTIKCLLNLLRPTTDSDWSELAGGYHFLALKSDGSLWGWGLRASCPTRSWAGGSTDVSRNSRNRSGWEMTPRGQISAHGQTL